MREETRQQRERVTSKGQWQNTLQTVNISQNLDGRFATPEVCCHPTIVVERQRRRSGKAQTTVMWESAAWEVLQEKGAASLMGDFAKGRHQIAC